MSDSVAFLLLLYNSAVLGERSLQPLGSIMYTSLLCMMVLFHSISHVAATDRSAIVDLGYSKYEGVQARNGVSSWSGIRYAAAPVGNLRFRAPQVPPSTGDQVIAADKVNYTISISITWTNPTVATEDLHQQSRFNIQ